MIPITPGLGDFFFQLFFQVLAVIDAGKTIHGGQFGKPGLQSLMLAQILDGLDGPPEFTPLFIDRGGHEMEIAVFPSQGFKKIFGFKGPRQQGIGPQFFLPVEPA